MINDSTIDENRKRYDSFFIRRQVWNFLNLITNFLGCFRQVLKLFWDFLLHSKIVIDAMVQKDSSFDENQKKYDPFFSC
jgi:hypothetical protein